MYKLRDVDENNFDYDCGIEHLKDVLINDNLSTSADAEAVLDFIEDLDLTEYKIYYYLSLQGMSDSKIKQALAKDIAECEVW